MIDKIIEKIYSKYGVEIAKKHVWMALILMVSALAGIIFFFANRPQKSDIPESPNIQRGSNMPPRLKNK